MTDQPTTTRKPPLAARIEEQKAQPLSWKTVVSGAAVVVVAGVALYLVFPAITEVLASWPRLSTLNPWWLILAVAFQAAHFTCTFALQRLALRTKAWFPVITSQLAGNAITLIMPGGAAVGAAVQFRMLATSGEDTGSTVGGLAAFSLLGVGGLLALPAFALPVILIGAPGQPGAGEHGGAGGNRLRGLRRARGSRPALRRAAALDRPGSAARRNGSCGNGHPCRGWTTF